MTAAFRVTVAGVHVIENRVLLVQRATDDEVKPGRWSVPGGHVDDGESVESALSREMREETGAQVEDQLLIGISEYNDATDPDTPRVLQLNFAVVCSAFTPGSADADVTAVRYVGANELWSLGVDDFTIGVLHQSAAARKVLG